MEKRKRTIWSFFIRNYKFTFIIAVSLIIFGFLAIKEMPKESQPEVTIPIGVVVSVFPGASVTDVEELVTNVIEDKVSGLDNVSNITSASKRGISSITVEFEASADIDSMIDDLKNAIDEVKRDLPEDVEDPIVQQVSLDDTPFLTLAVSGPFSLPELKVYADEVKDEIERVPGVSTVQVFGGQERQIEIIVQKEKLQGFGLSLLQVTNAIERSNTDIPIGNIITSDEEFTLRFSGRIESAEDIEHIPVSSVDGVPVFIRDIGTVVDGYTEIAKSVRLSTNHNPSEPAVTIRVFKSSGGDVTKIADTILQKIHTLETESFPESITIIPIENLAEYIKSDLSNLVSNGIATIVIVTILLAIFLGWKEAILAAISIPLSFLITFIILFYAGYSINFMTLFSLILSLGILVDSTIVINESLHKKMQTAATPEDAADEALQELEYPLISGTLTTVFAFVPMLLTGGILGQFIKSIPITVTAVLLSSLFVALGVITTLSVFLAHKVHKKNAGATKQSKVVQYISKHIEKIKKQYSIYIHRLLHSPSERKTLKKLIVIAAIIAYALPVTGVLKAELFPSEDQDSFIIDVQKPFGTPLTHTVEVLEDIEKTLYEDERIESFIINGGFSGSLGSSGGGGEGSHLGYIQVNLKKEGRKEKSYEIVDEYQKKLSATREERISVTQPGYGPGSAAPVEITIEGKELATLDNIAKHIESILSSIEGTQNVNTSILETNGQFAISVNRGKAAQYGINTADVALTLRNAITGLTATQIQSQGEDVDVIVRAALNQNAAQADANRRITDISDIEGLTIATPKGEIPLSAVIDITLENSRESIQHEEGKRVVKVSSYLSSGASAGSVFSKIGKELKTVEVPDGYTITMGGEDEDTAQSLQDMFRAMILAVVLIAALLILQFKSFRQSVIILLTIPFALIGVFPGLVLVGLPLSFPGMIGIVALAGIVVNNAIILIDKINQNREAGYTLEDAVADAGVSRFEPIVLTTITTVSGMLPLALTQPIWASLGFAIVFGLLFSTVLTLVIVPLLYSKMYRGKKNKSVSE